MTMRVRPRALEADMITCAASYFVVPKNHQTIRPRSTSTWRHGHCAGRGRFGDVAGLRSQAAQVLVVRPAPGTVVVSTRDIMTIAVGQVTPTADGADGGDLLMSDGRSGGGLLAW